LQRLSGNGICVRGAEKLAAVLSTLPRLKELWLDGNDIRDEGAVVIADALKGAVCLQRVNFANTNIGDTGAILLLEALSGLPQLRFVSVRDNVGFGDAAFEALARFAAAVGSAICLLCCVFAF
jgi:Ran GTPase-activating protein (RanGAP) involved in mRNA processing and transport